MTVEQSFPEDTNAKAEVVNSKGGDPSTCDELRPNVLLPGGPPRAVRKLTSGLTFAAGASIVLAAGASTFYVLGGSVHTVRGATRSSQLLWQQRQTEIREALAAEQGIDASRQNPAVSDCDGEEAS